MLDLDENGTLDYDELRQGFKKFDLASGRIVLSQDDFDSISLNGKLLNDEGEVGCFVHHGCFAASAPTGQKLGWAVVVFIFSPRRRCVVTRAAARSLLVQSPAGQFLPSRPPQQARRCQQRGAQW